MAKAGITAVGHIQAMERSLLEAHFGSYAQRLHELAHGIDHSHVVSNRVRKQISAEDTFPEDIPLTDCEPHIKRLAEKVWAASLCNARQARTAVLKLKTKEFVSLTRSHTPQHAISTAEEPARIALALCGKVGLGPQQLYRLAGVGLSNFAVDANLTAPTGDDASGVVDRSLQPAEQVPLLLPDELRSTGQ